MVKNAEKTAALLARLDMSNIEFGNVIFYLGNGENVYGFGPRFLRGSVYDRNVDFRNWSQLRWRGCIEEGTVFYSNIPGKLELVAVTIEFKITSDRDYYNIECTDISTVGEFNRVISCFSTEELYLNEQEIKELHKIEDAISLFKKASPDRRVPVDSNHAVALIECNKRHLGRSDSML